jgi:hypothetical protein
MPGAVRKVVEFGMGHSPGKLKVSFQAARSIGRSMGFVASVCQAINLAHVDLTGGEQRPEQHGSGVC